MKIIPLEANHLEAAAALLCKQYRALRAQVPALPARYEQSEVVLALLVDFLPTSTGVAAFQGGQLVGFLSGQLLPNFRGRRTILSPEWANSAAAADGRRIYEAMYARAADSWVTAGAFTHLVVQLAHDRESLEGWHWLGFGMLAADAVRDLRPVDGAVPRIEIRRAGMADVDLALAWNGALRRHLASSPTFLPSTVPARSHYEERLANPACSCWLAYREGEAVAYMEAGPANPDASTIIMDPGTASVVGAFTRPDVRGGGVGAALLERALEWSRGEGYERLAVDFEPANVLAARFWRRHFAPICYALARYLDDRLVCQNAGDLDT